MFKNKEKGMTQFVDAYWLRSTDRGLEAFWGNLYIAESSLMGLFVKVSSDLIMHPVHMTICYQDSGSKIGTKTGLVTGCDIRRSAIFHSEFKFVDHIFDDNQHLKVQNFVQSGMKMIADFDPTILANLDTDDFSQHFKGF